VNSENNCSNLNMPETHGRRWMKLDNAAKIYPAARSKRSPAVFRLSMELTEDIDVDILSVALERTLKRLPGFSQRLRRGMFWYYFEHQEGIPPIQKDSNNPCVYLDTKANKGFLFRVRHYGRRLAVEFFHALTDGSGGMCFLKTLVAEYLTLKYGVTIPRSAEILDCNEAPMDDELEDSFLKYARPISKSRKEQTSYHIRGTREGIGIINITTGIISVDEINGKAKEYGATLNEFLTSLLIMAIYNVQLKEISNRKRNKPIKVFIPINLRKFYPSRTLRNFASYLNLGIDPTLGEYTLEEIIKIVKYTMGLEATEKMLNAKISTNVSAEENKIIRAIPLFLKNPLMKFIHYLVGDRYNSTTLSNLGMIKLPEEMACYVNRIGFILGAGQNPNACACVSFKDTLCFNFSRTIIEPVLEESFFTLLVKMGIHIKIESNQR